MFGKTKEENRQLKDKVKELEWNVKRLGTLNESMAQELESVHQGLHTCGPFCEGCKHRFVLHQKYHLGQFLNVYGCALDRHVHCTDFQGEKE